MDHTNRRPSLHASTHVRPAAVPNSNEVAKAQRRGTLHLRGISSFRSNSKTGGDQWRRTRLGQQVSARRRRRPIPFPTPPRTRAEDTGSTRHPLPHDRRSGPARFYSSTTTASSPSAKLPARREPPSRSLPGPGRFRVSVSQRTTRPPVTCLSSSSRLPRPSPPPVLLPQIYIHAAPTDHHQAIKRPNPAEGGKAKEGARRRRTATATATGPDSQRQTPLQLQLQLRWRWPLPPRRPRPTTCPWHRRC